MVLGFELHTDWKRILTRAWSIRFLVAAGLLSGLEVALPIIQPYLNVPPGLFAGASAACTMAAFVARIVAQKEFEDAAK